MENLGFGRDILVDFGLIRQEDTLIFGTQLVHSVPGTKFPQAGENLDL